MFYLAIDKKGAYNMVSIIIICTNWIIFHLVEKPPFTSTLPYFFLVGYFVYSGFCDFKAYCNKKFNKGKSFFMELFSEDASSEVGVTTSKTIAK